MNLPKSKEILGLPIDSTTPYQSPTCKLLTTYTWTKVYLGPTYNHSFLSKIDLIFMKILI